MVEKRTRSVWKCPECGGKMRKVGGMKTDGTIVIGWQACRECEYRTREIRMLLLPQSVRPPTKRREKSASPRVDDLLSGKVVQRN